MNKIRTFYLLRGTKWTENRVSEADIQHAS